MPKVQPYEFEERRRIVKACYDGNMARYNITIKQLAQKCRLTERTVNKHLAEPELLTLEELQAAAKLLHFTPIQAASIILGRDLTAKEIKDFIMNVS